MISTSDSNDLQRLADKLGHTFKDPHLLAEAVTHASAHARQGGGNDYERLEFLGDRVLSLIIADWLLMLHPDESEGVIARRFTELVRREALAHVAREIELGQYLRMSHGEIVAGARNNSALLADATEAVIGALYLDGGLDAAGRFVHDAWTGLLDRQIDAPRDPKTALQEWAQARHLPLPAYTVVDRSGPDHAPRFMVEVQIEGRDPMTAEGRSKRAAERLAAIRMLEAME